MGQLYPKADFARSAKGNSTRVRTKIHPMWKRLQPPPYVTLNEAKGCGLMCRCPWMERQKRFVSAAAWSDG